MEKNVTVVVKWSNCMILFAERMFFVEPAKGSSALLSPDGKLVASVRVI